MTTRTSCESTAPVGAAVTRPRQKLLSCFMSHRGKQACPRRLVERMAGFSGLLIASKAGGGPPYLPLRRAKKSISEVSRDIRFRRNRADLAPRLAYWFRR